MLKVENIEVYNIARAVYSARNALNSWDKSDSDLKNDILGEADLELARRLYKAGSEHRKYLRQIFVSMDITAPLYWWKEMDQYRINVTTNSCSTMHRLLSKPFEMEDFSFDRLPDNVYEDVARPWIDTLNELRDAWCNEDDTEKKKKHIWYAIIQLLPSSYNQKRTITMNYENVVNIIHQRAGHKLTEWHELIEVLRELPYIKAITNLNIKG